MIARPAGSARSTRSFAAPGTSTAPPRPSAARRSRRRSRGSGARCVSEGANRRVLVAGASGFAGALAAELVWHHPRLELAAATSRSDAGVPLRRLYPRYTVPVELTELDL